MKYHILPTSNGTARIRLLTATRSPIIVLSIVIIHLNSAQVQPFLWLIQRQDVDREESMYRSLIFKLPVSPAMNPAIAAEVFIDVLGSHLVVLDLGLGAGCNQLEVFRRDSHRRVALLQADGAVAA